jgi:hypothetical protein
MNEADAIGALSDMPENTATYVAVWISLTFAYLTAAYITGHAMSRFQCWVVTVLYFVTAFFVGSAALVHTQAWVRFNESQSTVYSELWTPPFAEGVAIFLAAGTLISLCFMYNVRHSGTS